MPCLTIDFLLQLKDNFRNYKTFIETGTYLGETIFNMEPYFDKLHTIEIAPQYFNDTKAKYRGNKINFILGNSTNVLKTLGEQANTDCIFFLDGHWSGGDTGKGEKDCPLVEECTAIMEKYKRKGILIIDDCRLFGLGPRSKTEICDWEGISKDALLKILEPRITEVYHLPSYLHSQDRLIVHIRETLP